MVHANSLVYPEACLVKYGLIAFSVRFTCSLSEKHVMIAPTRSTRRGQSTFPQQKFPRFHSLPPGLRSVGLSSLNRESICSLTDLPDTPWS